MQSQSDSGASKHVWIAEVARVKMDDVEDGNDSITDPTAAQQKQKTD